MAEMNCPVCEHQLKLKYKLKFNVYKCPDCSLLVSDAVFEHSFVSDIEETAREIGLKKLRYANFEKIIKQLKLMAPHNARLKGLEIGSGNGWWLKACRDNGIDCEGIEPEKTFTDFYKDNDLKVSFGFYPEAATAEQYDFIIFNDVFEHIPHVDDLVFSLGRNLKKDGLLIINIPLSTGFFYNCARILNKLGISGFMNRLWQFNFHSPHYTYFTSGNLTRLITRHQFIKKIEFRLETLDYSSIKERILTDKRFNQFSVFFMVPALKLLKPVISNTKPDIGVFFFENKSA